MEPAARIGAVAVMPASGRATRLLARQISELLLARAHRWLPVMPQDRLAGMVFEVVLSQSLAQQPFRDEGSGRWIGLLDGGGSPRPIAANAIAQSMSIPDTTVRRRIAGLIEAGLLVRTRNGVCIAQPFYRDARLPRICEDDAAHLARAYSALVEAGYQPAALAHQAVDRLPPDVVERLLLTFVLRVMETFTAIYNDVTSGTIVAAIIAANIRHITENPDLARLYAAENALPPDELREPITLRALAKAIDLPFETVRRRASTLIAQDIVTVREGGVVVPTAVLRQNRHLENNRRIVQHFEQMTTALVALAAKAAG